MTIAQKTRSASGARDVTAPTDCWIRSTRAASTVATTPTAMMTIDHISAELKPAHSTTCFGLASGSIAFVAARTRSSTMIGANPAASENTASATGGQANPMDGAGVVVETTSWSASPNRPMTPSTNRAEYANVRIEPRTRMASSAVAPPNSPWSAPSSAFSLAMKPRSGGTPAIEAAARMLTPRIGRHEASNPWRRRTSRLPTWWSMIPTTMNSAALNAPWASRSTMPAWASSYSPIPNSSIMKPSWLTVP